MRVLNECNEWEKIFSQWEEENPDLAKQLVEYETSKYKVEFDKVPTSKKEKISTRSRKSRNSYHHI